MSAQILDLLSARDLLGVRPTKARTGKPKPIRRQPEKPKPEGMSVLFVGGPMDGETRFLRPQATTYEFRFRPPNQPHVNALYEVAVEMQDGGEFHFVGFEWLEGMGT